MTGPMVFCDMDRVLVDQRGMRDFHKMGWMPGGPELWEVLVDFNLNNIIAGLALLSQVRVENYARTAMEKTAWVEEHLALKRRYSVTGKVFWGTPHLFCTPDSVGKGSFARHDPGSSLLIDDSRGHCGAWEAAGGVAVAWRGIETLGLLKEVIKDWDEPGPRRAA